MRMTRWGCLAVFVLALLVYLPSVRYRFVGWDDTIYVTDNMHLREGLTPQSISWSFTSCGYADNWHPLTWISLAGDISLVKSLGSDFAWEKMRKEPSALSSFMHGHNVFLHAANATLLFLLLLVVLRDIASRRDGETALEPAVHAERPDLMFCAFLSLCWAIHPLRTEVVCWVTERKELLSAFFMLLTLLFHFTDSRARPFISLIFFALALLAKPVAVTLPVLVLVWEWTLRRRRFLPSLMRAMPYAVLSFVVCVFTLFAQREAMPRGIITPLMQLVGALKAPFVYLGQTVCPINLSMFYQTGMGRAELLWIVPGVLMLVFFVFVLIKWIRTQNRFAAIGTFGIAWCYVGLMPMLGIVKVGGQQHSDRYTYWVGCGLMALILCVATLCREKWGRLIGVEARRNLVKVGVIILAVSVGFTLARAETWYDSETLFKDAWKKSKEPVIAEMLARELCENGKAQEADELMRGCASDNPNPTSFAYLALYLLSKDRVPEKDIDEAMHFAQRAEEIFPECAEVQQAYGDVERHRGNWKKALEFYAKAHELGLVSLGLSQRIEWTQKRLEEQTKQSK